MSKSSTKTNILMIRAIRGPDGGLEKHFIRIAKGLEATTNVNLVFVLSAPHGIMYDYAIRKEIPCHFIDVHDYRRLIANFWQFRAICKLHKVDVVQSHMLPESMFGRFARLTIPGIKHIFRVHTHIDNVPLSPWKKRLYHAVDSLTQHLVDRFAPLNVWLIDELVRRSHIPRNKIYIVTNGISPAGPPDNLDMGDVPLKARLGVVGRLHFDKGQHTVLEAVGLMKEWGLDIYVDLIGAGEDSNSLNRTIENSYIEELRNITTSYSIGHLVTFHGQLDDVQAVMKDVPTLVLGSYHEGISNAILEALSTRKVVIGTAVGGTPNILTHKKDGYLFPPGNTQVLLDILKIVYGRPGSEQNALRQAGFERWQNHFSTKQMIEQILNVYDSLGFFLGPTEKGKA